MHETKTRLVRILQAAYSGEMGAALAYRGHWKSLKNSLEKERIQQIEEEEWVHRENVGRWLKILKAKPKKIREVVFWTIGRAAGNACYVTGWFLPMYFAGLFETDSIGEYQQAAQFAREIGLEECALEMIEMAEAELEHAMFFKDLVQNHFLFPITKSIFKWD
jgi:demethoxyubiquinone hydroxylase (CLK1/Coq7/Cat5 family)